MFAAAAHMARHPVAEGMLLPGVHYCASGACVPHALPEAEAEAVRNATAGRKAEFATGRWCARRALANLGLGACVIPRGDRGCPIWPAGIAGSITHVQGFYCAAVSDQVRSLGIDAARLDRAFDARMREVVFTPGERASLERAGEEGLPAAAWIAFSAKESLFKCLFPAVRDYFDFLAAEVRIDPGSDRFACLLTQDLCAAWPRGSRIDGHYYLSPGFALTAVVLR